MVQTAEKVCILAVSSAQHEPNLNVYYEDLLSIASSINGVTYNHDLKVENDEDVVDMLPAEPSIHVIETLYLVHHSKILKIEPIFVDIKKHPLLVPIMSVAPFKSAKAA